MQNEYTYIYKFYKRQNFVQVKSLSFRFRHVIVVFVPIQILLLHRIALTSGLLATDDRHDAADDGAHNHKIGDTNSGSIIGAFHGSGAVMCKTEHSIILVSFYRDI